MKHTLSVKGKILAYWQILAGMVSVVIVGINFLQMGLVLAGAVLMIVSALSVVAGFALLKGKPSGIGFSWLIQLIQLPALYLKGFYFQIFLLLSLDVGKHASGDIFLNWHTGSGNIFRLGELPFQFAGVNLVALIFCFFLAL